MDDANKNNNEINNIMQENYNEIKRNGKFWFIILLAIIPGLYFSSLSLHLIKIRANQSIRCKINSLENKSWTFQEIQKLSQPIDDIHRECFIYNYDYNKIANMSFKDANKFVYKNYPNKTRIMCSNFVQFKSKKSNLTIPARYPKEFANYCESTRYEIYYDLCALIFNISGCLFLVPFADIYGRKRILAIGCHLALLSIFVKILLLPFTRPIAGEIILNFAFPALKYTTQTIIFEISGNVIRPLAFVLTYLGLYIPVIIFGLLPPMYWKYMELITYIPAFILPLTYWYMPESPLWLMSKNNTKLAKFVVKNLNNFTTQNEQIYFLRNRKLSWKDIKKHLEELKKIRNVEYISLVSISILIGLLLFYPYSKHKILFQHFEDSSVKYLNYLCGIFVVTLCIIFIYSCGTKFSLAIFFSLNGILYLTLCWFISKCPSYKYPTTSLITFIEVMVSCINITYEFYLQKLFPVSHKCTCMAIWSVFINLGLLTIIGIRLAHTIASEFITAVMNLLGLTSALLLIKNLRATGPLKINFENINNG